MKKKCFSIIVFLLLQLFVVQFLAAQPIGYATVNIMGQNGTSGGAGGPVVTVSNSSDLIDYMSRSGPYIIQVSGMIKVPGGMHQVTSNKTVIGIGSDAGITDGGLNVGLPIDNSISSPPAHAVYNVIIRNLTFEKANDDCINVMMFTHHFWIDHNTFLSTADGALDIKRGSNYGTVSYNHFVDIHKTCLLGASDDAANEAQDTNRLKVTYHHNYFDNCQSRQPRVRWGEPHVFNNYWLNPGYAIGRGKGARVYSENNHKDGSGQFSADYGGGAVKDIGSIGGFSTDPEKVTFNPSSYYSYTADPASSVKSIVTANAGVGKVGLPPTPGPTDTPTGLIGDVNGDELIDIVDALLIAQYYVDLDPEGFILANADFDKNGIVDIIDALLIAQYYVGLIELP